MKTLVLALLGATALSAAGDTASSEKFVRDFYAAYHAKDLAPFAQFYAPDATFVDPSFELNLKGADQIRALFSKVFPKYESLDWEIAHTTSAGSTVTVEGVMVGKLQGKTIRVPFVSVFEIKDGKIAAQRDMFDVAHYLSQVGAIPPPFGPKPTPSP